MNNTTLIYPSSNKYLTDKQTLCKNAQLNLLSLESIYERKNEMYWDNLAYFICLVEKQTLTACADEMDVQHSTVARRIEHLENALNVNLFDRIGKRYVLTAEGELLYCQAIEVKKEIVVFERMAIDQNVIKGKVVVSAPPVWANEVLMPCLTNFRQQFPAILLELCGEVGMSNLHQRDADIALRLHRPTQEDLIIRTLGSVKYKFFAHADYIAHCQPKHWQLIEFTASARILAWSQALTEYNSCSIAFSTNDLYIAYNAACQKLGFALLPDFLAAQCSQLVPVDPINKVVESSLSTLSSQTINSGLNVAIPLMQEYPIYLVMHPDVRRSARVRAVADWLITTCAPILK